MKQHIRTLLSVILLSIFLSAISFAAETRGLTIVAKDTASGRQGEVRFYNKTYAVIIGIDRYQNLPAGRQLHNAVRDAKGIENVLRKNYQFDKIIILQNEQATKDRIMEVLTEELPAQMGRNDALFLFWAGQERLRRDRLPHHLRRLNRQDPQKYHYGRDPRHHLQENSRQACLLRHGCLLQRPFDHTFCGWQDQARP